MVVVKCDRCGKIFSADKNSMIRLAIVEVHPCKKDKLYDMCDDCEKKLSDFLDNISEE